MKDGGWSTGEARTTNTNAPAALAGLLIDGECVPPGMPVDHYRAKREFASGI
jgi:hypothetical protein